MKILTLKFGKQVKSTREKHSVEYQEISGVKYLLLKRDWTEATRGEAPKTMKCPFCGSRHTHRGANGYRMAHCLNAEMLTCIAHDGSLLKAKDGYIVVDVNKN